MIFLRCFDYLDRRKLLSREVHCDSGQIGEQDSGLSVGQVISGDRPTYRKFRSRRERISIAIKKRETPFSYACILHSYEAFVTVVVVVVVIVSIFIGAVLSSNDKLETSANDRGDRTKSVEYIGKGIHAKRDGKIRKYLRPFPVILSDLQL